MLQLINSMIPLVLLTVIASIIRTAIIQPELEPAVLLQAASIPFRGTPIVSRLAQNYLYNLTIRQTAGKDQKSLQATVSFAKAGDQCDGFGCYYGWINNFTQGETTTVGYSSFKDETNPIFGITLYLNKTLAITKPGSLSTPLQTLVQTSINLLNPIFAQLSNLNPLISTQNLNKLAFYKFQPLQAIAASDTLKNELNSIINLNTLSQNYSDKKVAIGWSTANYRDYNSSSDVLVIDRINNQIIHRIVKIAYLSGETERTTDIQLELINDSLFTDLTAIKDKLSLLSSKIQSLAIAPSNLLLSRLQLPLMPR